MGRKKNIILVILLALVLGALYVYREYNREHESYKNITPDFVITATALIGEYEANDSLAAKKYNGNDLEVSGIVKTVEKDDAGAYTVVLGGDSGLSSVRCSMDSIHQVDAAQLKSGSPAILRGACTGYNRDEIGLGSDVILNRSVVINKK